MRLVGDLILDPPLSDADRTTIESGMRDHPAGEGLLGGADVDVGSADIEVAKPTSPKPEATAAVGVPYVLSV